MSVYKDIGPLFLMILIISLILIIFNIINLMKVHSLQKNNK
jgi:hypothetical protein